MVQDKGTPAPRWINKCTCTTAGNTTAGSIQTTGNITLFGASYPLTLASPHVTNNELGNSRYSVADGNWNNTATWATRSGGPSGASVPTNQKRVIIEAGKRIDVNVAAAALKVTIGNNGAGILDFNATTNSLVVGGEGIIINSNGDVEGTSASAILRTTGDVVVDADISVESSNGTTPSTFMLLRETTGGRTLSGTGTVTNYTNNASTTLTGTLTIKQTFAGSANNLINAGTLILKGTAAQITANLVNVTSSVPNTIEYDNTIANFDFTAELSTYHHLVLSGSSVKRPSSVWTVNGDLTLNPGVTLNQSTSNNDIIVKGNWLNLGATFTPSANASTEVTFSGASEQTILSAGNAFGNVIINNSSSTGVVLQDEMKIGNGRKLTLTDGYLFLGNNNLVLLSTNVNPTASSASFVVTNGTGTLGIEAITGSRTFPVGSQGADSEYTPVIVDNTGGTSDRYDVKVCDNVYTDGNCSGGILITSRTINKTWNVSESVAGGSSVDLTLQWNASHELPNFTRNACFISHYTGGMWMQQQTAGAGAGAGPYTKTVTNLTGSFSPFGIGSGDSPLPIELLEFNAVLKEDAVVIDWITSSEKNNDYFVIERTSDGISFLPVATIKGAGNSEQRLYYSTVDSLPVPGVSYYRLKQVDFDGNYSLSKLVSVTYKKNKNELSFVLYPNPAFDRAYLSFYNVNKDQDILITVYDISGKVVYSKTAIMEKDEGNIIGLYFSENLPRGIYIVVANSDNGIYRQKLIISSSQN